MNRSIAVISVGLLLLTFPLVTSADQISDLQAQVQTLLAQIIALQRHSSGSSVTSTGPGICLALTFSGSVGAIDARTGGEVSLLQSFLQISPTTGYFGPKTKAALQAWQSAHGVLSTGYVGPLTRAAMTCSRSVPTQTSPQSSAQNPITPASHDISYIKQHSLLVMEEQVAGSQSTEVYTIHPDGTGKKILNGAGNGAPSWTPDGKIIFVSSRSGSPQIWIMDEDGQNAHQIGNIGSIGGPIGTPQLGKNGLVVFADVEGSPTEHQDNPGPNNGTWIMNEDGSGLRLLLANCLSPSLALSGTWLTCTRQTETPYHREIWRINTDDTGLTQLTFPGDSNYPDGNSSSISPDEQWVAFFSGKESDEGLAGYTQDATTFGYRNVAIVPAEGGARITLTTCKPSTTPQEILSRFATDPTDCLAADGPTWLDNNWIIYMRGSKNQGMWMIDRNGKNDQALPIGIQGSGKVLMKFI